MTLEEQIKILEHNAEHERQEQDLQGCLNFKQLAKWLRELKAYREAEEAINRKMKSGQWSEAVVFGFNHAIYIIDKHLKEVNADE